MVPSTEAPTALAKIGREILRLRLFYGWSQAGLGRRAKLSQGTISRLERGLQRGLCIRRLAAVMEALHVQEVTFQRPSTDPQTALEIMLFGDRWQRAIDGADRRLRWPVAGADQTNRRRGSEAGARISTPRLSERPEAVRSAAARTASRTQSRNPPA